MEKCENIKQTEAWITVWCTVNSADRYSRRLLQDSLWHFERGYLRVAFVVQECLQWSAGGALIPLAWGETSHSRHGQCAVPHNGILHHRTLWKPTIHPDSRAGLEHTNRGRCTEQRYFPAFVFFFFFSSRAWTNMSDSVRVLQETAKLSRKHLTGKWLLANKGKGSQ